REGDTPGSRAGLLASGSSPGLAPPSRPSHPRGQWTGTATRLQWRDRAGFSPASLFSPVLASPGHPRPQVRLSKRWYCITPRRTCEGLPAAAPAAAAGRIGPWSGGPPYTGVGSMNATWFDDFMQRLRRGDPQAIAMAAGAAVVLVLVIWLAARSGGPEDRKSTRLNSSHVKISY